MRKIAWISCLAGLLVAGSVGAQSIGIFFDAAGTTCSGQVGLNVPGTLWVIATLDGPALGGVGGGEFQITGFPPSGWFPFATGPTNTFHSLGTPTGGGFDIGFTGCATGTNRRVELCHVNFFPTTLVTTTQLRIEANTTPSNRFFACPLLVLCDFPAFTKVCARGDPATINGSCTVASDQSTWSKVKQLYE